MRRARLLAGAVLFTFLSACSSGVEVPGVGEIVGPSEPAALSGGVVVGEVPLAVEQAAAVLREGGSAADAATAMYFALAVTYPQAAGLGGGGVCLVHDAKKGRSAEYDFPASAPPGGGPFALPGNIRGFEALQRDFGTFPWSRDVVPGERLAETGFPVSQALEERLLAAQNAVRLDADVAALFMDESGQIKPKGTFVSDPDLAGTLAAIRTRGAPAFYRDEIADKIGAYAAQQGGAITAADLASYAATRSDPDSATHGAFTVLLPAAAGGFAAGARAMLGGAAQQSTSRIATAADDTGAAGFAARDANGQAVACAVTMNGAFGSGHTVPDTGVTLARAPEAKDMSPATAMLAPALVLDQAGNAVLAAAAAGSVAADSALAAAIVRATGGATAEAERSVADGGSLDAIQCNGACTATPDRRGTGLGLSTGGS